MGAANLLPALFGMQAVSQIGETYSQQGAIKAQDRYQKTQAGIAQRRLEIQAKDVEARGAEAAGKIKRETAAIRGAQRAGYAGQGVAVDSGTPGMVGAETELYGELDAMTARNNAWREAWGLRNEAADIALESQMKSKEAKRARRSTIVTGGLKALQSGMLAGYYGSKAPKTATSGGQKMSRLDLNENRFGRKYTMPRIRG